jgi:hypothetical protein
MGSDELLLFPPPLRLWWLVGGFAFSSASLAASRSTVASPLARSLFPFPYPKPMN